MSGLLRDIVVIRARCQYALSPMRRVPHRLDMCTARRSCRSEGTNVVIACLPDGYYGPTPATTVPKHMARTFSSSLHIGLRVSLGEGIPSAKHDIRLGDIVISCPNRGVLQCDMGKLNSQTGFWRTGSLNSPPRRLLSALSIMRATELTDDP